MSDDYDDETEQSYDARKAEEAAQSPTVSIQGLSAAAVEATIRGAVESNFDLSGRAQRAVDKAVNEAVRAALDGALSKLAEEHLRPLIAEIVANGWQTYDSYGYPKLSAPETLNQKIREKLFGDRHQSMAERIFTEQLSAALKGDLGTELARVKDEMRKRLNEEVFSKFTTTIREGLGLKG